MKEKPARLGCRDQRSKLMRRLWAPSAIRCGASIEVPSKGRHKKLRRLSRARPGGAAASQRETRRRFKHSWFRGGRRRRLPHEAVAVRAPRRPRPADAHGLPGRKKLRGPYHIRALRVRWRAAGANRARLRSAAKRSGITAGKVTASGLELIDVTLQKVQQLKLELDGPVSWDSPSGSLRVMETAVEIIFSPSQPIRQDQQPVIEQMPAVPLLMQAKREGGRSPIAPANLESAITEAVRKEAPGCEALVGVIVQPIKPKSRFDANWVVRGVKFGRTDREKASEAIAVVVERMQREFKLPGD
jgi:hypothetical protein